MRRHLVIPDCQVKHGVPTDHLTWIGKYIVEKQPDVIINIGDFADMPSLSSYDRGKKSFEGRRYHLDVLAAREGMDRLLKPIRDYNAIQKRDKKKLYRPEMHFTLGNHEDRITRAIESDPILEDTMGLSNLMYEKAGWTVHPFLKPVEVDGVSYCHYYYNPMSGKPYGGQLDTRLKNIGFSFTMGHQQGLLNSMRSLNNGKRIRGLVAGSCYLHFENYIGHQANEHWQGIIVKNEVRDGNYDLTEVSLNYLCRKYEGVGLTEFLTEKYGAAV